MLEEAKDLLRAYLACFIRKDVLQSEDDILKVEFTDTDKQVADNDLDLGIGARRYLCEIEDETTPDVIAKFYR